MYIEPLVYFNGKMLPASKAHVAIYDASVVLGATLNDMERTFFAEKFLNCMNTSTGFTPHASMDESYLLSQWMKPRKSFKSWLTIILKCSKPDQELGYVQFISPGEFKVYEGTAGAPGEMKPTFCIHTLHFSFLIFGSIASRMG